jgi:hypothetical protein
MSEKIIYITECDLCLKKVEARYNALLESGGWNIYYYQKDWKNGSHMGKVDCKLQVCDKCNGKKGLKVFFKKILKLEE